MSALRFEWCARCTPETPSTYHDMCARKFRTVFDVEHECDCPLHYHGREDLSISQTDEHSGNIGTQHHKEAPAPAGNGPEAWPTAKEST